MAGCDNVIFPPNGGVVLAVNCQSFADGANVMQRR